MPALLPNALQALFGQTFFILWMRQRLVGEKGGSVCCWAKKTKTKEGWEILSFQKWKRNRWSHSLELVTDCDQLCQRVSLQRTCTHCENFFGYNYSEGRHIPYVMKFYPNDSDAEIQEGEDGNKHPLVSWACLFWMRCPRKQPWLQIIASCFTGTWLNICTAIISRIHLSSNNTVWGVLIPLCLFS